MRASSPAQAQRCFFITRFPRELLAIAKGAFCSPGYWLSSAPRRTPDLMHGSRGRHNAIVIPWLRTGMFPPIDSALDDPNGLLAAGGDLSAGRLLAAYAQGIFPWY